MKILCEDIHGGKNIIYKKVEIYNNKIIIDKKKIVFAPKIWRIFFSDTCDKIKKATFIKKYNKFFIYHIIDSALTSSITEEKIFDYLVYENIK